MISLHLQLPRLDRRILPYLRALPEWCSVESGAAQSRSLGGVDWVLPRNAGILAHNSLQLAVRCSDQVFFQNFVPFIF